MSEFQLPDDTAEDRVLAATEFLDPSTFERAYLHFERMRSLIIFDVFQPILVLEGASHLTGH